tara:strand:+ start:21 stop:497 length:477 start_codon:yes stop_codon:yes gene_type:complete
MSNESIGLIIFLIVVVVLILFIRRASKKKQNKQSQKQNYIADLTSEESTYYNALKVKDFINNLRSGIELGEDEEEEFKKFLFRDGGKKFVDKMLGISDFNNQFGISDTSKLREVVVDLRNEWTIYRENKYQKAKDHIGHYNYKGDYSKPYSEEIKKDK